MVRHDRHITEEEVVDGLSRLIKYHLQVAARQQYNPDCDADRMDAEIADGKARAAELRRIRHEFEDVVTGVI